MVLGPIVDLRPGRANLAGHAATPTAHHSNANDPTAGQKAALAGTSGAPGSGNKYVTNADTRNTNSRAPTGAAGGSLGGTYPNPSVRKLRETGGPTTLTLGAIADGKYLKRSGSTVVGDTPAGGSSHAPLGGTFPGVLSTGLKPPQVPYRGDSFTIDKLYCRVAVAPVGQDATVQVRRNGVSMGTVTISDGDQTGEADVNVVVSTGDYFDINITQVGSSPNEGSDLVWLVVP